MDGEPTGGTDDGTAGKATLDPVYAEQLTVPWWWYPIGWGVAGLLAAELHLGHPGIRAWLPYVIAAPLVVVILRWAGHTRIRIDGGELLVRDARLPLRYVGGVQPLDAASVRLALGRESDPAAFVVHRPWVRGAVLVTLTDPADPTPYWLVSSGNPAQLAAAVTAARADAAG